MTWTKTGEDFPDRLIGLSDPAYRLHHAALTYCNRLNTDGLVTFDQLTLIAVPNRTKRAAIVEELVVFGLWDLTDDGYLLLDFLTDQPSKAEVEATRAYDAARQQLQRTNIESARVKQQVVVEQARMRLKEAKDQRSHVASQRESQRDRQRDIQRRSQRPVPSRHDPARPDTLRPPRG